jgi:hypothetical protein
MATGAVHGGRSGVWQLTGNRIAMFPKEFSLQRDEKDDRDRRNRRSEYADAVAIQ